MAGMGERGGWGWVGLSHQLEQWDARTRFKGCLRLLCDNRPQKSKHREGNDQPEACAITQREACAPRELLLVGTRWSTFL